MTTYWKWRVLGDHPEAWRVPPWPMSEDQAAQWSERWGCVVEKIEGSEYRSEGPAMGGSHRDA
jgi:hypothetical protein